MLSKVAQPLVRLVDRYLPDPYVFVLLLSLIAIVAAMAIEGHGPLAVIGMWGDGFWGLLAFSMQMLLVLVTGFMLASTPPVKRVLVAIAGSVKSPLGSGKLGHAHPILSSAGWVMAPLERSEAQSGERLRCSVEWKRRHKFGRIRQHPKSTDVLDRDGSGRSSDDVRGRHNPSGAKDPWVRMALKGWRDGPYHRAARQDPAGYAEIGRLRRRPNQRKF